MGCGCAGCCRGGDGPGGHRTDRRPWPARPWTAGPRHRRAGPRRPAPARPARLGSPRPVATPPASSGGCSRASHGRVGRRRSGARWRRPFPRSWTSSARPWPPGSTLAGPCRPLPTAPRPPWKAFSARRSRPPSSARGRARHWPRRPGPKGCPSWRSPARRSISRRRPAPHPGRCSRASPPRPRIGSGPDRPGWPPPPRPDCRPVSLPRWRPPSSVSSP